METIDETIARKRAEVETACARRPLHELAAAALVPEHRRNLVSALTGPELRLVAEIRRPPPGDVASMLFDPRILAQELAGAGAAAIGVWTEDPEIGSEMHLARRARHYMALPVICRDMFVDPYQVYQAAEQGADAVALTVALVSDDDLWRLMRTAGKLGMAAVVVVRDGFELESALAAGAEIICIDNRALESDKDDLTRTDTLAPHVPAEALLISTGALVSREEAERVSLAGADAAMFESPVDNDLARDAIRKLRGVPAPGRSG